MSDTPHSTSSDSGRFMLGAHEAQIKALQSSLDEHKEDTAVHLALQDRELKSQTVKLDKILEFLNRFKGSWKTLLLIGAALVGLAECVEAIRGLFNK